MDKKIKILGVIPARIGSTRLKEKMLADLCGKTVIQRTYEQAKTVKYLDDIVIATDSEKIKNVAESFGARVIITSIKNMNGTEAVAEAVSKFEDFVPDIVVNIFGDEPLIPADAIEDSIMLLINDEAAVVSGVAQEISEESDAKDDSFVLITFDKYNNILSFSRSIFPYPYNKKFQIPWYQILGSMAFRRDFLFKYASLEQTPLELYEGIEQLRILENGYKMKVAVGNFNAVGINTVKDLERAREILGCIK